MDDLNEHLSSLRIKKDADMDIKGAVPEVPSKRKVYTMVNC